MASTGPNQSQPYTANSNSPFNYGQQETQGLSGISKDVFSGLLSVITSFSLNEAIVRILNWISDIFVLVLHYFWSLIGTFIITNIDFSSSTSYLNGQAQGIIRNVFLLFVTLGVALTLSFFFLNVGTSAMGLGRGELRLRSIGRLLVAISIILFIPMIASLLSYLTNSVSFLIYKQNTMNTQGVLQGLENLTSSSFSAATPELNAYTTQNLGVTVSVRDGIIAFLNISFFVAFLGCMFGMMIGSFKISKGDPKGSTVFFGAALGVVFIFAAFQITRYLFGAGHTIFPEETQFSSAVGNTNFPKVTHLSAAAGYNPGGVFYIPPEQTPAGSPTAQSGFWASVTDIFKSSATQEASIGLTLAAAIIKIFVSVWGCWLVVKVFFQKIYQLLVLMAIFVLSPVIASTIAHPAIERIGINGATFWVKYHLYSVCWAIAIIFMYMISSINFGFSTIGAQNFETALAMLGGLLFLEKVEGLVGLLTGTGGPSVEGAMRDFEGFKNGMIGAATMAFSGTTAALTAGKQALGSSWGGHHAAGAALGGAMGFLAPVAGMKMTTQAMATAGVKMADFMGNAFHRAGSSNPNPYDIPGGRAEGGERPGYTQMASKINNLADSLEARSSASKGNSKPGPGKSYQV